MDLRDNRKQNGRTLLSLLASGGTKGGGGGGERVGGHSVWHFYRAGNFYSTCQYPMHRPNSL